MMHLNVKEIKRFHRALYKNNKALSCCFINLMPFYKNNKAQLEKAIDQLKAPVDQLKNSITLLNRAKIDLSKFFKKKL